MARIEFAAVARVLTCREFAEAEGMKMRGGRAQCPFHGGEHYNLKFFDDGRCYCHVCHETADVVKLASAVWHTSQRDAAVELNERFKLGLKPTDGQQARRSARDVAREEAARILSQAQDEAKQAWDMVNKFDKSDDQNPEYAEALRQANNADVWVRFKRFEALQVGVEV